MNTLNYLITTDWKGKPAIQAFKRDLGGAADVGRRMNRSLTELKSGLDLTMQGLGMAAEFVSQFYSTLKEGTQLQAERLEYENLARSIGTTAESLTSELIPATKGMMTNAELIRGASELINLGIAGTQEETVAWTQAVSALNLDLQVLGMTLANDSVARLDSLKLAQEDVNEKVDKFVAMGHEYEEAFDLAVLEALQDKMALLGDSSETAAGKMQRLEVSWQNLMDKGKLLLAERFEPIIGGLVDLIDVWGEAQNDVNEAVARGLITEFQAQGLVADAAIGLKHRQELLRETREQVQALVAEEERQNQIMAEGQAFVESYMQARQDYNDQQRILNADADAFGWSLANVTVRHFDHVAALEAEQAAMEAARATFASSMSVIGNLGTVVAEAYGAEAQSAEDSALRIETANMAIQESYRETAVSILEARLAETIEEDGLAGATAMIQFQEALGLITPEEAAKLQEIAEKTELITTTTNSMLDTYLADGVLAQAEITNLASAVELIGENSALTEEQIIGLADTGGEKFGDLAGDVGTVGDEFLAASIEAGKLKDMIIDGIPNKKVVEVEIRTSGALPEGSGRGALRPDGYRAIGGPVWAGGAFVVGERGPELFVPRREGTIVPNAGASIGDGGVTINQYNNTREAAALSMAMAEQLRRQRLDRI